jgi:predicted P-loop ATPase
MSAESSFKDLASVDDLDELLALSPEEMAAQEEELVSWVSRLERSRTGYKNTAYNMYLILKNLNADSPTDQCVFAYDEFNQSNIYTFVPPWGSQNDVGRELTDLDDIRIQTWLSREWGIETSEQKISSLTLQLGKENSFHPVQRYLKSLKWDGKERLNTLLTHYCGAVGDTRYLADLGRKFLTAAVARVFEPGIKFDHILILEGDQGIGKSTFVRFLAGQWYSDSLGDISNKDVVDNMRGRWLIELGELASMNRAEANELKAFVTRQWDITRKAYGRRAQSYPRQCVFIGTTNDDEYLKDATGGRRFWCVKTTKFLFEELHNDRDQLWAEAYFNYQLGEVLYLDDPEVRMIAEEEQSGRYAVDEIQSKIEKALESENVPDKFSFEDIWAQLQVETDVTSRSKICDYYMQQRIKKALRSIGCPKIRAREDGRAKYFWLKKVPQSMFDTGAMYKLY